MAVRALKLIKQHRLISSQPNLPGTKPMNRRLVAQIVAGGLLSLGVFATASASTIFIDDFSDGSVTNGTPLDRDGNPVVWTPLTGFDQGTGAAASGDYVLTTPSSDGSFVSLASHGALSDTSVRAQMRLLNGNAAIAVFARADAAALTAYQAGISTITGNAYIVRNTPTPIPLIVKPANRDITTGDIAIQLDVIGQMLQLFVWDPGTSKPDQPFIEIQDSTLNLGVTGVLLDSDGPATGVFRYVQVADTPIPEPSTMLLVLVGSFSAILLLRNCCNRQKERTLR
jgi:hypothetical protein